MSAVIKLNEAGAAYVALTLTAPPVTDVAPPATGSEVAQSQGDARKKIKPNVKQAEAPSVMEWEGGTYLRLAEWLRAEREERVAVVLMPSEDPFALEGRLEGLAHIAIDFPKFSDGRGYSHATLLRTRLGYRGELRAVGDVLRDQLFLMRRCGFDAFRLKPGKSIEDALTGFADFSDVYQAGADGRSPLFRRRLAG